MKRLLAAILFIFSGLSLLAQRIVENPKFSATTAEYVKIKRITLSDTVTKIDFEVKYFPNWWIKVSSTETYIRNSDGGEKNFVKRAEGIKLNELHWTPEIGVNLYSLYFSPIDRSVSKIDFMEESWKIFDIDLTGTIISSFLPESIKGNWLKTDGSNEWMYGIYDDKVIYKNKVWNNILLNEKGKSFELTLKDGSSQEKIYIKPNKGNLLIGASPDKLQLFSKNKTYKSSYAIADDEGFDLPLFKLDTAVYKGFIKGYHPKMGGTGIVYVDDIIMHEQNSHLIMIEPDGSFQCKVPMIHPQQVFVQLLGGRGSVYLDPGKTTFQYVDLSEYTAPYMSYEHWNSRERKSLFMGDAERVNSDLITMDQIVNINPSELRDGILDMTAIDFKTWCLAGMKKNQDLLDQLAAKHKLSRKALQIKRMQISYGAYESIMSFNYIRSFAYREKHKIPIEQREIPLEDEVVTPEYFDFINPEDLNNPLSLVSGSAYITLINRVRFSESVRNKYGLIEWNRSIQKYDSISGRDTTIVLTDSIFMVDPRTNERIRISGREEYEQIEINNFKKFFGLESGFAMELMLAQKNAETMQGTQKPISDPAKREIRSKISNEFVLNYLMLNSEIQENKIKQKLAENKIKTGYVINETPKSAVDKIFDSIISKYRGKVVFVDFWATWCGPCISGIERIKPLKEEMKGEDIEFVYITNPSSPADTWNMMVPDIKGEHYRVEQDHWNHLASKFNISGIPHYVLVDKNGNVVQNSIYFASSNDELKKVFNEYLKN